MQYRSIAPTPALAQFIERFRYSSDAPAHQKVRIIPNGTTRAIAAMAAGLIAAVNGALNLAFARGGPGSGNGVVGGAAALVLGLIAMVLGVLALVRSRHTRSGVTSPSRRDQVK
jgi:Na+-driven multidrug efflux pump